MGNIMNNEENIQQEYYPASVLVYIRKPVIEWVSIPEGRFMMGSLKGEANGQDKDEQHPVYLSAFMMSKYAITFEQYDMYCEATGHEKPDDNGWGRGKRPVINVSLYDAITFANFMGCRLPTEAEWEYACRSGTVTKFNTGMEITPLQANFRGGDPYNTEVTKDFRGKTMPVGSFSPNAWGLYDMHGNVNEWCTDYLSDFSSEAVTNPKGPSSGALRVLRGGSWESLVYFVYSACRFLASAKNKSIDTGFRLVYPK